MKMSSGWDYKMDNRLKDYKDHFRDRFASLKRLRQSWIPTWRELAEHFIPEATILEETPSSAYLTSGRNKQETLVDGTGIMSLNMLAAGMQSGLTSPTNRWFELSTGEHDIDEQYEVKVWLYDVENKMLGAFAKSNFYNVAFNKYIELGGLGTSADIMVADPETIINCIHYTPGTYCLGANSRGFIDTIYREYAMTAKQLVEEFGYDNVSKSVKQSYDKSNTEELYDVVHCIEPNYYRDMAKSDNANLPYVSAYYESGTDEKMFLRISGYNEQPFFAPRWSVACNNIYGGCPARNSLGHVKMLQEMQRDTLRGLAKQVKPPMVASPDIKRGGANVMPNGITYTDTSRGGFFQQAFQVNFDLNSLNNKIALTQEEIRKFFYNDLFLMQAMTSKRQTAYETEVKEGEKLRMLSPVIERLQYEYLDLVIKRAYGIMSRGGYFNEPPQQLQGANLKINYIGILAKAQKMLNAENIGRVSAFIGNFAGIYPQALDILDIDTAIKKYAHILGLDPEVLRNDDEVARIRENRAKAMQEQQARENMPGDVQAASLMTELRQNTEGESLAAQLSGGI